MIEVVWCARLAGPLRGAVAALVAFGLMLAVQPAVAKQEYRALVWTWRVGGLVNLATRGDFDLPLDIPTAFNVLEEQNYAQCLASNCGSCTKHTMTLSGSAKPGYDVVNGQSTVLTTPSGMTTRANSACTTTTYTNGVPTSTTTPQQGPWITQPDNSVTENMIAILHCPEDNNTWSIGKGPITYTTANGQTTANYQAWCERFIPDPPCPICQKTAQDRLPPTAFGNPIDAVGQTKLALESDYHSNESGILIERFYSSVRGTWSWPLSESLTDFTGRSQPSVASDLQSSIRVYDHVTGSTLIDRPATFKLLKTQPDSGQGQVHLIDALGARVAFNEVTTGVFGSVALEKPELVVLSSSPLQWQVRSRLSGYRVFDASGQLIRKVRSDGKGIQVQRSSSEITLQSEVSGRSVSFELDTSGTVTSARLPDGQSVTYVTDTLHRVTAASYPDGTTKGYKYGESAYVGSSNSRPMWLTGLIDENAVRVGTYSYDGINPAATEQAGGVNRYSFWYGANSVLVTRPNGGTASSIGWLVGGDGERHISSDNEPAGAGYAAATTTISYDSLGNASRVDDVRGYRSCYLYDALNQESARVQGVSASTTCSTVTATNASLPTGGRKTSTTWHPDWRLATQVAEPGKLTTSVYNGQPDPFNAGATAGCAPSTALLPDGKPIAVLCKRVEQATTDADGHLGFTAALQSGVASRVSSWTYNSYGQVLSETDPLNHTTTYAYYSDTSFTGTDPNAVGHTIGDLQSVTNAAGQATTYDRYDKHGNVLQSTDPNGVVTSRSYDLRQRLLSTSVGGQATSYSYDAAGQLLKVTAPDTSWIGYEYDAAHRRTAVKDNLGNRIEYTLDNAGNVTAQNTKDPAGALARTVSRTMDALGRVQQTSGRE